MYSDNQFFDSQKVKKETKSSSKKGIKTIRALQLYKRRKYDEAIDLCNELLDIDPLDKTLWWIKCRSLTQKNWIDDTDFDEEGIADLILGEGEMISENAKPLTSLRNTKTADRPDNRPSTQSGKKNVGFVRPSTRNSTTSSGGKKVDLKGQFRTGTSRAGTSRPITPSGRFHRLGTQSLAHIPGGQEFIRLERFDFDKYASKERSALGRALCDYILYVLHDPKEGFELARRATETHIYKDWWWQNRLGKAYYLLGAFKDAEGQFKASLRNQDMIQTYLQLAKVFMKLDQPQSAIDVYSKGSHNHPIDTHLILGKARVFELLGENEKTISLYKQVLELDAANVESIACIASTSFYEDQPEIALRLYRRLLQMGVNNVQIWNNLGLSCFYASQYDITINCFEKALILATEDNDVSDVWYNIGILAIGLGDIALAFEAFKISLNICPTHAQSLNCLGVIDMRKGNLKKAKQYFLQAKKHGGKMYEQMFNLALCNYKLGELKECYDNLNEVLSIYPKHSDSRSLKNLLQKQFK